MAWGKKIRHQWEYLPFFQIHHGVVIAVKVCKRTGACHYVKVPSAKKLKELEKEAGYRSDD